MVVKGDLKFIFQPPFLPICWQKKLVMYRQFQSSNVFLWCIVFLGCVGSRLLSTIYHIEDIDSLRFALSIVDYDVTKLQPHFPAYPVFCFVAKLLYILIGRYALAFSIIGGVSVTCIIYFTLKIAKIESSTILGKILILVLFMNPLLWLMSNRYMPDAMGLACLLASLYFMMVQDQNENKSVLCRISIGYFLAGILYQINGSPIFFPFCKSTENRHAPAPFLCFRRTTGIFPQALLQVRIA